MVSIITIITPEEMQMQVARSAKRARLERNHSRSTAAQVTGVPESTLRKFEDTGKIAFHQLLLIANTYGELSALTGLFPEKTITSIDEIVKQSKKKPRSRGRA